MRNSIGSHAWRAVGVLAITLLGGLAWAPEPAFSAWTIGKPIVTYFHGPGEVGNVPLDDARAAQVAAGGYNLVWVSTLADLDVAQAHGLRGMWVGNGLGTPVVPDETIMAIRNHPALYAYFVDDEPYTHEEFVIDAATVSRLRTLDPNHLAYINLSANFFVMSDKTSYPAYVDDYISTVNPSLLSVCFFPFKTDGDFPQYFQHLALFGHKTRETGIPFMNIDCIWSYHPTVRVTNDNELRYLRTTSLAYGAQATSDYVYTLPTEEGTPGLPAGTGGMVGIDGTTTLYDTAKTINPQFVAIAQEVQPMTHVGAYHLGDLPPGFDTTDGSSPMRLPSGSPFYLTPDLPDTVFIYSETPGAVGLPVEGAVMGFWGPEGGVLDDATFTMVVNLDYSNALETRVNGPGNLSVFDTATGTWIAQGHAWADVSLLPGGGVLVGLTSAIPESSTLMLLLTGLICYTWWKGLYLFNKVMQWLHGVFPAKPASRDQPLVGATALLA